MRVELLCWFKQIHRFVWREHVTRHVSFACKWKIFFFLSFNRTIHNPKNHIFFFSSFWQTLTKIVFNGYAENHTNILIFQQFLFCVGGSLALHLSPTTEVVTSKIMNNNLVKWFRSHETNRKWNVSCGSFVETIFDKKTWQCTKCHWTLINILIGKLNILIENSNIPIEISRIFA